MKEFEFALEFAKRMHKGQVDKAGEDYINHPIAVSKMVEDETNPNLKIAAILHDVIEDTCVDESVIRKLFGDEIADAVVALTKVRGESYEDYLHRVARNEIARKVKIADISHNMDLSRLPKVTENDLKRLEKYKKAKAYLESIE